VLFACLFLSQAALLVLSPTLPAIADEFGISTPAAGQLRTLSGTTGGLTALALVLAPRRPGMRAMLSAAAALTGAGSLAGALAPSFAALAAAQALVGVGIGVIVSVGIAAAGAWTTPQERPRTLAWAIAGMPVAWVLGMPVAGEAAAVDWRLALGLVPTVTAVVVLALVRLRPADAPTRRAPRRPRHGRRDTAVLRFAAGELLANAAWASVLTYSGALLIEGYGASPTTVAVGLAGMAAVMVPGTHAGRRHAVRPTVALLTGFTVLQGGLVVVLGAVRPGIGFTLAVMGVMAFFNGWRTMVASSHGMDAVSDDPVAMMSVRGAANQFGYLVGALAGGLAIAAGGFTALGVVLGALFAAGAAIHVAPVAARRVRRARLPQVVLPVVPEAGCG
jgi:MFS transporter, DHA1 family, inner membrane transport protein